MAVLQFFLHGVERVTYNLDISLPFTKLNLLNLIRATGQLNLKPRIPEPIENILSEEKRNEWIEEKGALVYTLISGDTLKQIDILLSYPKTFDELKAKAVTMDLKGKKVLVSSIDDLIAAKLQVKPLREKDEFDIKQLKKIKDEKY